MSKSFQAYSFEHHVPTPSAFFDEASKRFTPASEVPEHDTRDLVDAITLAVEAGVVLQDGWVKQLFGTKSKFELTTIALRAISPFERVSDRAWHALATIAGVNGKVAADCWTYANLSLALEKAAKVNGQV